MKVHEYQAKALLSQFGIPVPKGGAAKTPAEAREIAAKLGGKAVIKAQVHTGGRGKAGGIKIAASPEEAEKIAAAMIGSRLATHQTGPQGLPVNTVLVEETADVDRELYLGMLVAHAAGLPMVMASAAGGMDIEEVARQTPEKVVFIHVDPALGLRAYQTREIAYELSLKPELVKPAAELINNLYRLFWAKDCSLAEINPLVVTRDGRMLALDAKLNFDDNAAFRRKELEGLQDPGQEDPLETEAASNGLNNYVKFNGNIGVIINGAGLAMAAVDLLHFSGGAPANFLDIGTVNDPYRMVHALRILKSDANVKAVMVNIFGGIAKVDVIAAGLLKAVKELDLKMPIVVRLAGTNVAEGERILAGSGVNFIRAYSFQEAAEKAVAAAKG